MHFNMSIVLSKLQPRNVCFLILHASGIDGYKTGKVLMEEVWHMQRENILSLLISCNALRTEFIE